MTDKIGVLVKESDGSPDAYAYQLIFPNSTVSITNSVATISTGTTFTSGLTITIADTVNDRAIDITNNDVTNDPESIYIDHNCAGKAIEVDADDNSADDVYAGYWSAENAGAGLAYCFYGADGLFYLGPQGLFGATAASADFANAQMIVSQANTTYTNSGNAAVVGESDAVDLTRLGCGVLGVGRAAGNQAG